MKTSALHIVPMVLLCITLVLPLVMPAYAQEMSMAGTDWFVYVFSYDANGQFTGFSFDRFTFKGDAFSAYKTVTPSPFPAHYTEEIIAVLPDLYNIWECSVPWGFTGQMQYTGIRSSKNLDWIMGRKQYSGSSGYSIFLGKRIVPATPAE